MKLIIVNFCYKVVWFVGWARLFLTTFSLTSFHLSSPLFQGFKGFEENLQSGLNELPTVFESDLVQRISEHSDWRFYLNMLKQEHAKLKYKTGLFQTRKRDWLVKRQIRLHILTPNSLWVGRFFSSERLK